MGVSAQDSNIRHRELRSVFVPASSAIALAFATLPSVGHAQMASGPGAADQVAASDTSADQGNADQSSTADIVVTGTLIRGVAPAGTNVIGVTAADVQETGATTTAQLLQTIPQLGSFNGLQVPAGPFGGVTSNRPNLRNLPGFNVSGSSPTLVLVDGHRVVGAGVSSTSPDPDIIPPGAIERVEIVPDGGSAIYGSDAVAGVINFITRKKADGLEVGGTFGGAHSYRSYDVNATLGRSWNAGSAYVSYNYSQHSQLTGRELGYVFQPATTIDGIRSTSFRCAAGNVTVGNAFSPAGTPTQTYALTSTGARGAAGTNNQCDDSDAVTIYPRERRHSVVAGLNQDLSEALSFDVRAFYTNRRNESQQGPNLNQTMFGPSFLAAFGFLSSPIFNANKVATGFLAAGETQTVYYQFGGPNATNATLNLETYGIAPAFTYKFGDNFRLRSISSYGESETVSRGGTYGQTALNNAITAGLFNPYNPSASDAAALAGVSNYEIYGRTRQRQFNTRLTIDGDLFRLPAGAVKVAVGGEFNQEAFINRNGTIVRGTETSGYEGLVVNGTTIIAPNTGVPENKLTRTVKSAFGEVVVPLIGQDSNIPIIRELTFSAAGRYDHYSDFGGTFNPKFGVTYRPIDWVKVRGAYGKSFVAPSLADDERVAQTVVSFVNLPFLLPAANSVGTSVNGIVVPAIGGRSQAIVQGNAPDIEPQRAKTISAGLDLTPPFVPGLRLSATYFKIKYKGVITQPGFTSNTFYPSFIGTPAITFNPSQAQLDAVLGLATSVNGTSCGGNASGATPQGCYVLIDARKRNLANFNLSGLDFGLNYNRDTGFGSVDAAFNGNYELTRDQQATSTAEFVDQITANASRFKFRTSLGANVGGVRAQATLNHSQGYDLDPAVGFGATQTRVRSFNTVDLFFKYDLGGEGMLGGTSLTLNANNVLNQDPPLYLQQSIIPQSDGYINGATIGRYIQVGINKKF